MRVLAASRQARLGTQRHGKADPSSGQVGRLGSEGSSGDPVGFHPPLTPAPPKGDSGDVDELAPSAPKGSPALTLAALHRGSTRQDRTETVLPSSGRLSRATPLSTLLLDGVPSSCHLERARAVSYGHRRSAGCQADWRPNCCDTSFMLVEVTGLEPATSTMRTLRETPLLASAFS